MTASNDVQSPRSETTAETPAVPILVHIPHSAVEIPDSWRRDLVPADRDFEAELLAMTERYVDDLFSGTRDLGCTRFDFYDPSQPSYEAGR